MSLMAAFLTKSSVETDWAKAGADSSTAAVAIAIWVFMGALQYRSRRPTRPPVDLGFNNERVPARVPCLACQTRQSKVQVPGRQSSRLSWREARSDQGIFD